MKVSETLAGLLAQYSPSGSEAGAVDYLLGRMQALGYCKAGRDEAGNAVGVLGDGPRQLVLLGHIDTVPGEIPPRVEGDHLYGRGAVDAKGPLAAFVDAAAAFGAGIAPEWQVVVIGVVEEERDSLGARHVAGLYHPEMALIGEPTGWDRIGLGYKGSAAAALQVRQALGHSAGARPSAPELALVLWGRLQAWAESYNADQARLFDQLLLGLRAFRSGSDGFHEWAELLIGARLPLELPPAAYYTRVRAQLTPPEGVQVSLTPAGFPIPAYRGEKNSPLGRALLRGIRAVGGKPGYVLKTGTADLNIVAPAWGCPALVYGPGDSRLDHTPDERLSLVEYERAVEVLTRVLAELTSA